MTIKKLATIFFTLILSSNLSIAQDKLEEYLDSKTALEKWSELSLEENYEEALKVISKVNEGDSNYVQALIKKTNSLFKLERYEEALEVCELGLSIEPRQEYQAFKLNKGYTLSLLEKNREALEVYRALKAEYPFYVNVGNNMAYQYLKLEEYDSSYVAYKEHARRFPFDDNAHFNLGVYAYNQSNFTEAFLALNMVILLDPYSDRALRVLKLLNEVSNNTNTKKELKEGFSLGSDEYSELDLLIQNYVALNKKYKVDTKSGIYLAKQNHLIFSQLQQMEVSDYFYSNYYAPFYQKVMEEGWYDEMQHMELIPSSNEEHQKIVAKELEDIKKFNNWFRDVWYKMNNTIDIEYENIKGQNTKWFYGSNGIEAIGRTNKETGKLEGDVLYLWENGQLKSKGVYKEGNRDGRWLFYRENGLLKQDINYKDGDVMDSVILYNEAGEVDQRLFFKENKRSGEFVENYLHGKPYQKGTYKDGLFDGPGEYFYSGGNLEYKVNYAEGKLTGELVEYYSNNAVYRSENFKEGASEGDYRLFWPNGDKRAVASTIEGDIQGKYESFYQGDKPESVGEYIDGKKSGEWKSYYRNGNVSEIATYQDGDLDGKYDEYDYDGVLLSKKVMDKGYLASYQYFDKSGELLAEGGHKKKYYTIKNYHSNGQLSSTGEYAAGKGKQGKWQEFDEYGNLSAEYNTIDGSIDGELVYYYPWGVKKSITTYEDGTENGYYVKYYAHGQLETQGYFRNGDTDGIWENYYPDGTLEDRKFFQNDELAGKTYNYSIDGKLYYEEDYKFQVLMGATFYDTSGNVLNSFQYKSGSGVYERDHYNGKPDFRGSYVLDKAQGEFVWKSPTGEIETKGNYMEDTKEGKWEWFHENGQLSQEGKYVNGFKEGEWTDYYDNGQIDELSNYIGGKLHGMNTEYYRSGKKRSELPYEYSNRHGDYVFYDESGEIQLGRTYKYDIYDSFYYLNESKEKVVSPIKNGTAEVRGKYHNGKPSREFNLKNGYFDGDYKIYHFNGNIASDHFLEFDEWHGSYKKYFADGNLKLDRNYYYGYLNGESIEYYESGKKKSLYTYRYGVKHGPSVKYNEDGSVKKEAFYYNGREL